MCGIVGVAARDRAPIALEEMSATLRHRGPDDEGMWWSEQRQVGLAHRRLAILDLSPGGHQPMSDPTGQLSIAFNGEIYNFAELRRELEQKGHSFRSASDTEVMLAAYAEWGVEFLKRLNGMFVFALYDARSKKLLLARDRAGEKPLFYRHHDGRLLFASELKALAADPAFIREVDPVALDLYLAYGYVPADHCIFRGVQKLRQGEAVQYDVERDTLERWSYWRLPESRPDRSSPQDLVDELESLLEDAVRRQLVADVPVGILLSGGVDSSLVTALAARVSGGPVKTFNVAFHGHAVYDESAYARMVARHFGTDHTEIAGETSSVDLLPLLAKQYDEPIADHAIVPTYIVSRMIRQHATVALGGDGGDELFGGYGHYSWLMRQERFRRFVPAPLRSLASAAGTHLPLGMTGRNHLIGFRGGTANGIAHINLVFDRKTRRELTGGAAGDAEQYRATLADPGQTLLRRAMETDFRSTMVDGYLVKVDRASMLNSLEIRAPFLAAPLIDFAYRRVPDSLKATMHERKILPRMLAARLLPKELDLTRKQGFTMPLDSWFKQGWGAYIEDVLMQSELFDKRVVARLLRNQRRGMRNGTRLFALTMLELWRREYRPTFC